MLRGRGGWNRIALSAIPGLCCISCLGQGTTARLDFAERVTLVGCESVSPVPVFRIKFNTVSAEGSPAGVQLSERLKESIVVRVNGQTLAPFYAAAENASLARGKRATLILVDISGSMNAPLPSGQTRFEAAKAAILSSLDEFEPAVDNVAIVPFESHNVESQISSGRFASSKLDAIRQIDALPVPNRKNNTALFSAIVNGLEVLGRQKGVTESMLVVMTDGKNEILPGDDPGLLAGSSGLDFAAARVKASRSEVIGVGFGDPTQIDETALTRISTKHFMAEDQAQLGKIFHFARVLLNTRLTAAFLSPRPDLPSLASAKLNISAQLKLASGELLESGPGIWSAPQIGTPAYQDNCTVAESRALIPISTEESRWTSVLRPVCVFAGLGTLLLVLWFWVPRLVWADQYVGVIPTSHRWMQKPGVARDRAKNAPSGFGFTKSASGFTRKPADATIVQPRTDFSKTRLDREDYSK